MRVSPLRKLLAVTGLFSLSTFTQAQVAINTTNGSADASAMLDVSSTSKGLLLPRMTETQRQAISSPAKGLIVYQTDGTEGLYCNTGTTSSPNWLFLRPNWSINSLSFNSSGTLSLITSLPSTITSGNAAWLNGLNTLTATGSFGTNSNNHVDFYANNVVRGRMTNLGEFFWGTTNTTISGDLFGVVSSATFPWAVSGYSSNNGGGVYGQIQGSNTTHFAGVQGENTTTTGNFNSAGVRGVNSSATAGTGFRALLATGPKTGVIGNVTGNTTYSFGVHGTAPSTTIRTGGLFGDDGGIAMGAVGYYASNGNDYSFYAFGNISGLDFGAGSAGGKMSNQLSASTTHIGLGAYGGLMGGWMHGLVYGTMVKGERYSLYVDGKTFTNEPVVQLVSTENGNKIPTYSTASMQPDVYARGKGQLREGRAEITFDASFIQATTGKSSDLSITVTPMGNSKGVYIADYDGKGFTIVENSGGRSDVSFSWIAIGVRKNSNNMEIPDEILESDFETKMDGVMQNELKENNTPQHFWWDGKKVRYDKPPVKKQLGTPFTGARPLETEGTKNQ